MSPTQSEINHDERTLHPTLDDWSFDAESRGIYFAAAREQNSGRGRCAAISRFAPPSAFQRKTVVRVVEPRRTGLFSFLGAGRSTRAAPGFAEHDLAQPAISRLRGLHDNRRFSRGH